MKRTVLVYSIIAVFAVFCSISSVFAAEVCQGKCIQYDKEAQTISIEEYDTNFTHEHPYGTPTAVTTLYNVASAKIGITPEPGDILRMAYEVNGPEKVALKVMNVSKQDLRKK